MLKDISKETSLAKSVSFIKESTRMLPKSSCEDIDTLNYKEMSGSLVINREYQRNFIQTKESASAYIESIFLGLIIPEIQVFEDYNTGEREIIDGQQRVLSLLKFYRGEYKLTNLKKFPELNGLYYNDLPIELKNIIKNFQVNVRVFTNSDEMYKFLIFERLNTGTKKLNAQEVRNCVYRGEMINLAKSLAELDEVIEVFVSVKNVRYERVEAILNIMSIWHLLYDESAKELLTNDNMKVRVNRFLELSRNFNQEELESLKNRFLELTNFISENLNVSEIMRAMYPDRPNYAVCKTICESLYAAFYQYNLNDCKENIDTLKELLIEQFTSKEYKEFLGTSDSKKCREIIKRNNLLTEAINLTVNQATV